MIMGIRPENMKLDTSGQNKDRTIPAKVKVVEPLGDRKDVYFETLDGSKFIANLNPKAQVEVGQTADVLIDIERVHIFEPGDKGKNIALN